jgi:hypothetical protein
MDDLEKQKTVTPWERFVSLARKVTQTPKTEVEKREKEWRRAKRRRESS